MKAIGVLLVTLIMAGAVYADRPVARWDVVADQRISSTFKAGVVAFHPDGVKVEFRVNGSLVHTANNPTLNDRVNVWEYWFSLDPSNYSDGAVTLDAKAIPLNGTDPSYDLSSLTLYANSGGSLNVSTIKWADAVNGSDSNPGTESQPYKTVAKAVQNTPDGGTVYLKAGTYSGDAMNGGNDRIYWTTVSAAPGLDWDDVEISPGFPNTDRLRLKNLAIFTTNTSGAWTTILNGEGATVGNVIWLDEVKAWNKNGRYAASTSILGNSYGCYTTGGITTQTGNGPAGKIVRDHHVQTITSDVFTGEHRLVVNCTVDDVDKGSTSAHPDFHQSYAVAPDFCEDMIMYNVKAFNCSCQGFFGSRLRNSAFVNVVFEKSYGTFYSQYSSINYNNLYFHITLASQTWLWRGTDFDADNIHVANSIFSKMTTYDGASTTGLIIDTNHFSSTTMGTNITTGDPLYVDADNDNYKIQTSSPAYGTGKYLQCVPADVDGVAYNSSGRNRGCFAAGTGGGNTPPVADAGSDQTVTDSDDNGSESVTLDGSGSSDSDGSITSYLWEENSSQIATGSSPTVSFATGSHTVTLTVTDDDSATDTDTVVITVNAAANTPPVANAGSDQSVTDNDDNGSESVTLNGSVSSDSDGSIVSYSWEENSSQIATGVSPSVNLAVGSHTITLTVTDDDSATDTDTVVITVNAPGGGQTFVINGDTADTEVRSNNTAQWAGGGLFRVGGAASGIDGAGVYVFQLPTLGAGETVSDANFDVHLYRIANTPGGNVDLYGLGYRSASTVQGTDFYQGTFGGDTTDATALQDDFATISASDDTVISSNSSGDSALASYIAAQYAAGAVGGDYIFLRLNPDIADVGNYNYWEFTSANGSTVPVLTITTNSGPSNVSPVADAGADQTVNDTDDNGSESVTLDGSGSSDSDGSIASYVWEENSSQIATGVSPSVSLAVGVHNITLTVTDDDSATDTDTVVITVSPYVNIAPTANAGPDQGMTDNDDNGSEQVVLDGSSSSDSDGSIVSYVWEENSTQIATGDVPVVVLSVGVHTVTLTVTDDDGATDTDTVVITVDAYVNVAPTADAGADQTVTDTDDSGSESVTLDGSGSSDSDGTIAGYVWEENSSQIATGVSPSVSLSVGVHTISLTVTDDDSATDTDTVTITVDAAPTGGQTYTVYGDTADNIAKSNLTVPWAGGSWFRVGGDSGSTDAAAIYVFQLPTLGTGESVTDANFDAHLYEIDNTPGGNVDLYGLGYRSAATVLGTDYYQGVYDGDSTDATALQDDFAVITTPEDSIVSTDTDGDSALASYIAAQYAAGAVGGDYIFLRLNPDIADVGNYNYWEFTSANGSTLPVLTITTGSGNQAPFADAGADQTVTDSDGDGSASVTLDGTASTDADGTISSYVWEEGASQIATGSSAATTLDIGIHSIDLTVTDDDSATDTDTVDVTVVSRTLVSSTSSLDWPASTLPSQAGTFTVEFDMVPGSAGIDGVTGLSYGPGSWWSDLACIVRFNTSNQIEARDGSAYASDTTMTYTAGVNYHVRMVVDVPNNTYSVYVTPAGSSEVTLAADYDFRTEQLGITSIDNWTLNATNSVNTHTVSNLTITD